MLNIAALTEGINIPSARYRVRQYVPLLKKKNINLIDFPSKFGKYPPSPFLLRPPWLIAEMFSRLTDIQSANRHYSKVLLQRELISKFYLLEKLIKLPIIFDFDDAIFMGNNKSNVVKIIRQSSRVICGNSFLADWASTYTSNITIIPTGLDSIDTFNPSKQQNNFFNNSNLIIGWIGTSSNFKNLSSLEDVLVNLLEKFTDITFAVMSDKEPIFSKIPKEKIKFIKWSPKLEPIFINSIDIGVMPLIEEPWSMGKCSFKAIQYMAMEKPIVLSNIGMNSELVNHNEDGFLANSFSEWYEFLEILVQDEATQKRLGKQARLKIQKEYCSSILATKLETVINDA